MFKKNGVKFGQVENENGGISIRSLHLLKKTSAAMANDLKQLFGFEPASVNATDEGEWKEWKPMLSNAPLSDQILPSHVLMTGKEQELYMQCSEYFFRLISGRACQMV